MQNSGRIAPRDREAVFVARMGVGSDIRDHSNTAPDIAPLIRATPISLIGVGRIGVAGA